MAIETGTVISGKITGITDFGAFVEIEGGKTGMVHISEVSAGYVKNIKEHLEIGQEVKAKVISVSPEGKISLSIRKLEQENAAEGKKEGEAPVKKQFSGNRQNNGGNRTGNPKVWQGQKSSQAPGEKQSFEDMMARFKQVSDEKMSDLKRSDSKRGSVGYSRRGKNQ